MADVTDVWRSGKVIHGDQTGRSLGFPTANFDPELGADIQPDGVYSALVMLDSTTYRGALYAGPRLTLGETKRVLEIHLLHFDGVLYDKTLRFQVGTFIRPPMNFDSVEALKNQLADDVLAVSQTSI